jgi:hypothetical protein
MAAMKTEFEPGFELRFDLAGRAAVRVAGGPVAPRHVEPVPPRAPWVLEARCGEAAGWLLGVSAPADPELERTRLEAFVVREAAARLQALRAEAGILTADLLERLTHRLRTDVATLHAFAEMGVAGGVAPEDAADLPEALERTRLEALRRLGAARDVMAAYGTPPRGPEPVAVTLRAELEAAGRGDVPVLEPDGEEALALIPGPGWAACARLLAADRRLEMFAIGPDRSGWQVTSGAGERAVPWTERTLGDVVTVGHILAAAGGSAAAMDPFAVTLAVPAAPPSG